MKRILVIGLGNFGFTLASHLAKKRSCEIIAMDIDERLVQAIRDKVSLAVMGDATDRDSLIQLGVKDCDIACICFSENVAANILLVSFLKEVGINCIYAKASSDEHAKVLRQLGATNVVFPEKDQAERLAGTILNPDLLDFIRLSDDYNVVEYAVPERFYKKRLYELDIRKKYGVEVLAVRNALRDSPALVPPSSYEVNPDDVFIVLGHVNDLEKLSRG